MDAQTGRRRFGRFELDRRTGNLLKDGKRIRLQPQPSRVLAILVDRAGDVVTREELRSAIWDAATFVEFDQGLNYCIRQIRQALGDNATEPLFVETVKKVGYQFITSVERVEPTAAELDTSPGPRAHAERSPWTAVAIYATLAIALGAAVFGVRLFVVRPAVPPAYTQITSFNDPAFGPAMSPDGRMIAFIVGSDASFPSVGEIYTKLLPDGEPVRRTHDGWPKYGVAFSPDGSQITYTVADASHGWSTSALPALGGEPQLLVSNAAGLTWLDERHALFSEIKSGLHMGLVTATTSRLDVRDIYVPGHERGMAHYAYASPDRSQVLVVEMGPAGGWERCRLVPFDGRTAGSLVGPEGPCTAAAWSPDGAWMYFTARVRGSSHLWRQRFPHGSIEQLTFGPVEEDGIALSADGRSVLTSAGMRESGVWMHDSAGDHLISQDGYAGGLAFSRDGRQLYYLLRRAATATERELWVTDLSDGKSEPLIKGFDILTFNVSSDGGQVVFSARRPDGPPQMWLAPCDGGAAPRLLASSGEDSPAFGPDHDVIFRGSEGGKNYLFQMNLDGSTRSKLLRDAIIGFKGMSPDRRWAVVMVPVDDVPSTAVVAVSLRSGTVKRICPAQCLAQWSPDGARFYVAPLLQGPQSGRTVVVPVPNGSSMPELPASGVRTAADSTALRGSTVVNLTAYDPVHQGLAVAPGVAPDTFAYTKTLSHRNIFQIRLP
jgi:DNA-binding winged helix-turn-helix (wHTH) protein/Tol biopolymer transport system component